MWMCVRAEAWESRSRHNTLSRREDVCCARRRSRRYLSCCLSPYLSRKPTRVRPKYRNRSVSKYREEEFTGPRFGCGRRAARRGYALHQHSKGSVRRRCVGQRIPDGPPRPQGTAAGAPRPAYTPGLPSASRSRRAVSVRASSRASSIGEGRVSRFAVAHGSAPPAAREAQVRVRLLVWRRFPRSPRRRGARWSVRPTPDGSPPRSARSLVRPPWSPPDPEGYSAGSWWRSPVRTTCVRLELPARVRSARPGVRGAAAPGAAVSEIVG